MSTRRQFIGGLMAVFGGTAFAQEIAAEAVYAEIDGGCDAGRLAAWIDIYGAETVARHFVALMQEGMVSMPLLKNRLNRERQRDRRACASAARRERHAGDEVLYRGPIALADDLRCALLVGAKHVHSPVTGHSVVVTETDRELAVVGIGVSGQPQGRDVSIPEGSRLLIDQRRGVAPIWSGEVVATAAGAVRVHLWIGSRDWTADDVLPSLCEPGGGRVYETTAQRTHGLLGLPL